MSLCDILRQAYGPEFQEKWKKVREEYDSARNVAARNLLRAAVRSCKPSMVPRDVQLWARDDEEPDLSD